MFCLSKNSKIKTANRDIATYKLCLLSATGDIISLFAYFNYSKEPISNVELQIKEDNFIVKGYHSYLPNCFIKLCPAAYRDEVNLYICVNKQQKPSPITYTFVPIFSILVKCIIPKGTKYITNDKDEVVSETIKIGSYIPINLKNINYVQQEKETEDLTLKEFFNKIKNNGTHR